jgi:two-component system phosphate regulon sensor histidine kinase PhoR
MVKRTLFFQIFPAFLIVIFIIIFLLGWYITGELSTFYLNETSDNLKIRANLVREYILKENLLASKDLNRVCKELAKTSNTRVTIISRS